MTSAATAPDDDTEFIDDPPVRCRRCGRYIFEGDTGWFFQEPRQTDMGDGTKLTFMDRVVTCDGQPHEPEPAAGIASATPEP